MSVDTRSCTPGVPYGNTFTVVNRYCMTHAGHGKSRLRVYSRVDFVRSILLGGKAQACIKCQC